jgi:hypothetical protein
MLTEYLTHHERELRELQYSRPRYDRVDTRRPSRLRRFLRSFAQQPARATPGSRGVVPRVVIRPAANGDAQAIARLAELSERRVPAGPVLVAEVETEVVAALPLGERHVLADLFRPTGDVVQLLELRSEQLRAAQLEQAA